MIVVVVILNTKPEFREEYVKAMKKLAPTVHKEEGSITYELFQDPYDPLRMLLFEEWESQEALEKHLTQPHMKKHFDLSKDWFAKKAEMNTYAVLRKTPGSVR